MPKGDKDVLKADLEDGYTPIANLILEVLAMARMSGVQKGICLFLFRRTYGWGIKEDEISLKEFAEAVDSSSSYVSKQLKQLIKWNVIVRTSYNPGKTPTYTFNTRVADWDKGCVNIQGLNKCAIQGLYKCAIQGLNECARVDKAPSLDNQPSEPPLNKDLNKDKEKENIYSISAQKIFSIWNQQNIVIHKKLTRDINKATDKAVTVYGLENVILAIQRYAQVFSDKDYFFDYKWTLAKFLSQKNALPDFLDEGDKWLNYQLFKHQQLGKNKARAAPSRVDQRSGEEESADVDWGWTKT